MDLELGSNVAVDVAILALIPVLWIRMQRWNQIQSKYRKGATMMGAILLLVHVVLCIREIKKSEYYTKIYQLGLKIMEGAALLGFAVLFMVIAGACWSRRKHKSFKIATMMMGAIITLVFMVNFMRKSTVEYVPDIQTSTDTSMPVSIEIQIPVRYTNSVMSCQLSPYVSSIIRSKTFDVRKITTKVFFFLFVSICASIGI